MYPNNGKLTMIRNKLQKKLSISSERDFWIAKDRSRYNFANVISLKDKMNELGILLKMIQKKDDCKMTEIFNQINSITFDELKTPESLDFDQISSFVSAGNEISEGTQTNQELTLITELNQIYTLFLEVNFILILSD
jgi:hypothetical protein